MRDLKELVARVKANPGTISMGHNGPGTNGNLAALAIERVAGAKLNDIPFKGTSKSRTALLGGHVDIVGMSVSEFVMDREAVGLFKGLAQLNPVRFPALPEVPTARELGFDIVISSERGFAAPRGLPPEIARRLAEAIRLAVDDPDFLRGTSRDELALAYLSGPDWAASMAERRVRYEAIWNGAETAGWAKRSVPTCGLTRGHGAKSAPLPTLRVQRRCRRREPRARRLIDERRERRADLGVVGVEPGDFPFVEETRVRSGGGRSAQASRSRIH